MLTPGANERFEHQPLRTEAPPVGCFEEARYVAGTATVAPGARLLVFSDGAFEIFRDSEKAGTWQEFVAEFASPELQTLRTAGAIPAGVENPQRPGIGR